MAKVRITENELKQIIRERIENEMLGAKVGINKAQEQPAGEQLDYHYVMGRLKRFESYFNQIVTILRKNNLM